MEVNAVSLTNSHAKRTSPELALPVIPAGASRARDKWETLPSTATTNKPKVNGTTPSTGDRSTLTQAFSQVPHSKARKTPMSV